MPDKPQLGHYLVGDIRIIPSDGIENFIRFIYDNHLIKLTSHQARLIAQGLIICAERLDYPDAVAGPRTPLFNSNLSSG